MTIMASRAGLPCLLPWSRVWWACSARWILWPLPRNCATASKPPRTISTKTTPLGSGILAQAGSMPEMPWNAFFFPFQTLPKKPKHLPCIPLAAILALAHGLRAPSSRFPATSSCAYSTCMAKRFPWLQTKIWVRAPSKRTSSFQDWRRAHTSCNGILKANAKSNACMCCNSRGMYGQSHAQPL